MRRILERTAEGLQINARVAHSSRFAVVPGGHPAVGQILWSQTSSARQPPRANDKRTRNLQQPYTGGRCCSGQHQRFGSYPSLDSAKGGYPRAHSGGRKQSVSREFSNRGAVVKSWQLKKYTDDSKPPRILDLVHPDAAQQTGGWPFAVALNDQQQEAAANSALYQISTSASTLQAPADAEFTWSDGHLEITKR